MGALQVKLIWIKIYNYINQHLQYKSKQKESQTLIFPLGGWHFYKDIIEL